MMNWGEKDENVDGSICFNAEFDSNEIDGKNVHNLKCASLALVTKRSMFDRAISYRCGRSQSGRYSYFQLINGQMVLGDNSGKVHQFKCEIFGSFINLANWKSALSVRIISSSIFSIIFYDFLFSVSCSSTIS
jgi:hypothetical protein